MQIWQIGAIFHNFSLHLTISSKFFGFVCQEMVNNDNY